VSGGQYIGNETLIYPIFRSSLFFLLDQTCLGLNISVKFLDFITESFYSALSEMNACRAALTILETRFMVFCESLESKLPQEAAFSIVLQIKPSNQ